MFAPFLDTLWIIWMQFYLRSCHIWYAWPPLLLDIRTSHSGGKTSEASPAPADGTSRTDFLFPLSCLIIGNTVNCSQHTPRSYICVNDRTWKHKSQIRRGERSSLRRLDKGGQCSQGSDLHNQQQPLKAPPAAVYKTPSPLPVYPPFDPHPSYVDPGIHQWEGFRRSWLTFDIKPFPSCCLLHSQFWQTYIISSWIQILPLLVMVVSGCMSGLHHQSQVHPQDQHHEGYLQDHLQMDHHHRPHMQSHGFQKRSALPWGFSGGFRRRFGGYGSLGYTGYGHHHHHHHHEHCHFYEDGHHHCY